MTDDSINEYEQELIVIMIDEDCTFREAMNIDFDMRMIDKKSVIDLVEYLESRTDNLDTVEYYMKIWTGDENVGCPLACCV